jgi:hypothetical protein
MPVYPPFSPAAVFILAQSYSQLGKDHDFKGHFSRPTYIDRLFRDFLD